MLPWMNCSVSCKACAMKSAAPDVRRVEGSLGQRHLECVNFAECRSPKAEGQCRRINKLTLGNFRGGNAKPCSGGKPHQYVWTPRYQRADGR